MKPFRERNPVLVGLAGFAVIFLLLLGAFRADRLPLIGGGDTYYAEFSEIGGLQTGSEVRVAGVSIGKVTGIELDTETEGRDDIDGGGVVVVEMLINKGVDLGQDTTAAIQVRTVLGAMYVDLRPAGPGQLQTGRDNAIPVGRTEAPYDIVQAFSELSDVTTEIEQDQVAEALNEIAILAGDIPEEFAGAIDGLSRLSVNLADRDDQINALLIGLERATSVLNDKDEQLETLFTDADILFQAVVERRDAIRSLLLGTQQLSRELSNIITDNEAEIQPALQQLEEITDMLVRIEGSIDEMFRLAGPFARIFANTLGNGPWFEAALNIQPALDNPSRVLPGGGN